MATLAEQVALKLIAPAGAFDDNMLSALLEERGQNGAAAVLWAARAKETAELVDTSESGSSRKMSDIHKNAVAMAAHYAGLAAADAASDPTSSAMTAVSRRMSR